MLSATSTRRLVDVAIALVFLGVSAMGLVASLRGWIPAGDDAFLSLRSRHLFQAHPILLNNASSAGPTAGTTYNHPGAFPLVPLAPFTLLGGPGAVPFAVATVNAAWLTAGLLIVRAVSSQRMVLVSLVGIAAFVWSQGAIFLIEPWNPSYALAPLLVTMLATWGVLRGTVALLPVVVLGASWITQTHLSLVTIGAALTLTALLGWWRQWRRRETRSASTLALGVAAAVFVVSTAQMWVDQFFGSGNLTKIAKGSSFSTTTLTVHEILGVLISKLALPPWWFRGSWSAPVFDNELPGTLALTIGVCVVAASAVWIWFRRCNDDGESALALVIAVTVSVGVLSALKFPLRIGIPLPYLRWMWPTAVLWWCAVGSALLRRGVPRNVQRAAPIVAVASAIALMAVAWVPANNALSPNPTWAQDRARTLSAAILSGTDARKIYVEQSLVEASLWVVPAVIDQLDAAGRTVLVDDGVLVQQTSEQYRGHADQAQVTVAFRGGQAVNDPPPNGRRLAVVDALTAAQRSELDRRTAELSPVLSRPGAVTVNDNGSTATDAEALNGLAALAQTDPSAFLHSPWLPGALTRGVFTISGVPMGPLREAARLGALDGGRTLAVYLVER